MDYRSSPRFDTDQAVIVTKLDNSEIAYLGRLANLSQDGIQLTLKHSIAVGSSVKVEWDGTLLLGEIIYCKPKGVEFCAGLKLEDALYNTEALAALMEKRPKELSRKNG